MRLLRAINDELAGQGICRDPSVAGSAPPMWLEPVNGVPAPGEGKPPVTVGDTLVLAAFRSGGFPRVAYEKFLRRDTVDIWLRGRDVPSIEDAEAAISNQLIDKRNWTMGGGGGLVVVESEQWRPLQPLERDEHSFTFTVSYWFETYA